MQMRIIAATALLIATGAIAFPSNGNAEGVERRWWWAENSDDGGKSWGSEEGHHRSHSHSVSWTGSLTSTAADSSTSNAPISLTVTFDPSSTLTPTLISSSSSTCPTPVTSTSISTIPVTSTTTTTVFVTVDSTVTKHRTRHSQSTKSSHSLTSITASLSSNSPSFTISLSTGRSTGIPSSSPVITPSYTNTSSISIPLSTGYSTGIPSSSPVISSSYSNSSSTTIPFTTIYLTGIPSSSPIISPSYSNSSFTSASPSTATSTGSVPSSQSSSVLTSAAYTNSSSLSIIPFTTHTPTHTPTYISSYPHWHHKNKHHSHHKGTSITISSSMIFIAASSTLPTIVYPTSTGTSISIANTDSISNSNIPPTTTRSTLTPTTTATSLQITTTVSGDKGPTGTPPPQALLCGVHGFPVGDFFLGQLVESKPGVEITLQSCYEFCAGIFGIDMGCLSIEFFPEPGTFAPRCNLYSESVAQSIDEIIPEVANAWYDIGCGVPAVQQTILDD